MDKKLRLFLQLAKIDEAKREVSGLATVEMVDKDGEIFDYASSKPFFKDWSDEIAKATDGKSLGNVREMHEPSAVGKLTLINFNDAEKSIGVTAKIVDDSAWKKCAEGVYTGFSIGGRYEKVWKDGDYTRFTAVPAEISVVDNPCVPGAHFTAVKTDGTVEVRKFSEAKTKRVAGEDLPASAFAYVGDKEDTSTWKLPIKFSDEEKTKSHIRNALARFDQTQGIPSGERAKVKAKIEAAARKHGIEVGGDSGKVFKSMYTVANFASLLDSICYLCCSTRNEEEYEGDDSTIPAELAEWAKAGADILGRYTEEELEELTESLKAATDKLGKAGARHSAATRAHHEAIRKAMDAMNDHMDNMSGRMAKMADCYKDADEHMNALMGKDDGVADAVQSEVTKVSAATPQITEGEIDMLDPKEKEQLDKATADVAALKTGQDEIAKSLSTITKILGKMAGVETAAPAQTVARAQVPTVTVTKAQDSQPVVADADAELTREDMTPEEIRKLSSAQREKRFSLMAKMAFRKPEVVTWTPGSHGGR